MTFHCNNMRYRPVPQPNKSWDAGVNLAPQLIVEYEVP